MKYFSGYTKKKKKKKTDTHTHLFRVGHFSAPIRARTEDIIIFDKILHVKLEDVFVKHYATNCMLFLYPFMPSGLLYLNSLDLSGVWLFLLLPYFIEMR